MKKVRFSGLIFLGAFLLLSIFCGCEKPEVWPATWSYTVQMANNTDEYTHMWITGETMNEGNKIVPWVSRYEVIQLTFESATSRPTIFIAVGRNGQELTRVSTTVPWTVAGSGKEWTIIANYNTDGNIFLKEYWE